MYANNQEIVYIELLNEKCLIRLLKQLFAM